MESTNQKETPEASDKIGNLRLQLLQHRYRYYVLCAPSISDFDYDQLEARLRRLVEAHPDNGAVFAEYCPTKTVGSEFKDDYPPAAWITVEFS